MFRDIGSIVESQDGLAQYVQVARVCCGGGAGRRPIFGWAGLWRVSDEWGPVYSGVMTDCNEPIRPIHDRMPVLLHPDEYDTWLNGSFDDALAFQLRCYRDDLIEMTRTDELWVKRTRPSGEPQSDLL